MKRRDFLTRSSLALFGVTTRGYGATSRAAQPASGEPIITVEDEL